MQIDSRRVTGPMVGRALLVLVLLLTLSACGVRTVRLGEAVPLAADTDVYPSCATRDLRQPTPNLIIIRDAGFVGFINPHVIHLNGEPCADLMPGEKVSLRLPLGPHMIGTTYKWDLFGMWRLIETEVVIRDTPSIVRVGGDSSGVNHVNVSAK